MDCLKSNTRKLSWDEYFNWKEVKAVDSLKLVPNSCYNRKRKACANREEATSLKRQKPMTDIFKPQARTNEQGGPRAALGDKPEEKTDVDPDLQPNEAQVIQTTITEQDNKCDDILRIVHAIDSKINSNVPQKLAAKKSWLTAKKNVFWTHDKEKQSLAKNKGKIVILSWKIVILSQVVQWWSLDFNP